MPRPRRPTSAIRFAALPCGLLLKVAAAGALRVGDKASNGGRKSSRHGVEVGARDAPHKCHVKICM